MVTVSFFSFTLSLWFKIIKAFYIFSNLCMHWQLCNFTFNYYRKVHQLVLIMLDMRQSDKKTSASNSCMLVKQQLLMVCLWKDNSILQIKNVYHIPRLITFWMLKDSEFCTSVPIKIWDAFLVILSIWFI